MNHAAQDSALRRLGNAGAIALLAVLTATAAHGAQTDISSTPIITTTAALVKPNIMLLMDASGSMGRTHMPDEVETLTGPTSIGYKSSQCNALYYNPAQPYLLPRSYLNVPLPVPSFNSAPYAGYGSFYSPPDTSTVDLGSQFVAYDNNTLNLPSSTDTPQAAYYFVYSGPTTLNYAAPPCTDPDVGTSTAASDGGTWTKVNVALQSAAQQQNFTIWYAYYRTRLALIKSAASLTFAPLNDTKRIGFITVQPKDTPTSATINPIRYLPLGDFDSTQKNLWFAKLFSQKAKGASPAREGLARVGRYYGGQEDSINGGMAATGAADPIQYACQQNFTIMTTDGYWNGQTETPGGGGLQLDGVTKVGQQDGDPSCPLSDPYCPRPIWDGVSASTVKVTDKTNAYTDNLCSVAGGRFKSTYQTTRQTFVVQRDSERHPRRTIQYQESKSEPFAQTTVATRTVTQTQQTTEQYALEKVQKTEERYQHVKWTEQTTKVTEQYQLQTIQNIQQTFQTNEVQKQTARYTEQWSTSKSQFIQTVTQYVMETDQYRLQRQQTQIDRYQIFAHDRSNEHFDPVDGTCVPSPGNYPIECITVLKPGYPKFVDPASCTDDPGSDPDYVRTSCTPGPMTLADAAVTSCVPGTTNSGAPNFVVTTCTKLVIAAPAAFNGTCVAGPTQGPGPDYFVYICTKPGANNTSGPIASCTPGSVSSGSPNWITTTCSQPGPTNYASQPSLPCTPGTTIDGALVTTVCTKSMDITDYSAACVNDAGVTGPNFIKVTCTPATLSTTPMASASCVAGTGSGPGFIVTTCPQVAAGPYATATPTDTCTPGATTGAPNYYETTCSNPPGVNNQTIFTTAAGCGPLGTTPGTTPSWITRICSNPPGPNNQTSYSDPALCIPDPGTAFPFLKVTCTPATLTAPVVVDPAVECGTFGTTVGSGPGYIVTHCDKQSVSGPTPVGACTAGVGPAPDFIVTACGNSTLVEPVASCTLGYVGNSGPPDYYDITCVKPPGPNNTTINVASCTDLSPTSPNYVRVTCAGPTTISTTTVDPNTCPPGTTVGPGPDVYVTTCSAATAVAPYPTATAVASCVDGWNGSVRTTCSYPAFPTAQNYPAQNSAPCTPGTSTAGTVTTVCTISDVSDYAASCSSLAQSGNGPQVICGALEVNTAEPVPSCALGVGGAPYYETTTACNTVPLSTGDYAGTCTPDGGTTPSWVQTTCGERLLVDHIADSGCVGGFDGATGVRTVCVDDSGGGGHTYTVATTTTVTTTPYSGTVPTGPPVIATSTTAATPVSGGMCFAAPQTFPAKPPVDIAGCTAWPCSQTTVGAGGSENSLADVSQYYYKTDLRDGTHGPAAMNNIVPKAGTGVEDDNAPHQHMTTFALALGVAGTLKYRDDYRSLSTTVGDFADIRTGVKNWPLWPDTSLDYTNLDNYDNPKSIDDFWHTAVNGRGRYFNANNLTSVVQGLGDALAKIDDVVASGTAEAVSTLQPVAGNNFAYSTSYKSGSWQGDVEARVIDPTTGALSAPVWSAKALLDANTFAACDRRKIYLIRGGSSLVDFTWNTDLCPSGTPTGTLVTGLNGAEQAVVGASSVAFLSQFPVMTNGSAGTAMQQQAAQAPGTLLNFLRGQRGNEDFRVDSATRLFRLRDGVLGDIVDSQPVYVSVPFATYQDPGYSNFKSTNATRTPMLYVGANDGMLHAFYATTNLLDPNHGQEAWAVVPSAVLPNMYKLANEDYKRDGHQFYVDATPVAGDVFDGANWKTILVGGLNDGGKGYYALDITVPGAAPVAKWEFKQDSSSCPAPSNAALTPNTYYGDCNLGLTFGKPIITKLAGQWVVMFTSGYNNVNGIAGSDGQGFLYVVDAINGSLIYKIATGAGDAATPSGLGQINNYVDSALLDNTTLHVYGGDMLGNMWRFDFSPTASATLLGTATDTSGNIEPITIRPELAELNGKPFVMVGTGRLLGGSDVTDSKIQSVYGLRDPLAGSGPIYPAPLRNSLKPLTMVQTGTLAGAVRSTTCTANCGRTDGWVVDLAEAGERVNVDMKIILGALVFSSNVPEQVPCSIGGHSWINQVDLRTGETIPTPGSPFLGNSINVGITVLQLAPLPGSDKPTYVGIGRQSDATSRNFNVTPPPPVFSQKRVTWREVAK